MCRDIHKTWWRHQVKTFSTLVAFEFTTQRPVTRSFDVFFVLHLNKQLRKQSWGWWFETTSLSLWRHCDENGEILCVFFGKVSIDFIPRVVLLVLYNGLPQCQWCAFHEYCLIIHFIHQKILITKNQPKHIRMHITWDITSLSQTAYARDSNWRRYIEFVTCNFKTILDFFKLSYLKYWQGIDCLQSNTHITFMIIGVFRYFRLW